MDKISELLAELIKQLKTEIQEYYNKCYVYLKDLYSYKNIDTSVKFSNIPNDIVEQGIREMISATNSALNTIGTPSHKLSSETVIYKEMFINHRELYPDYNSFFELGLKHYFNKFLFSGIYLIF